MAVMKKVADRLLLAVAPPLYLLLSRMLFATCRVTDHGWEHIEKRLFSPAAVIVPCWHYSIFYIIHRSRATRKKGQRWVFMLSPSRDAEYLGRVLQKIGIDSRRGSRGKGGLTALKNMVADMRAGKNAGIVADGSQGPARKVQAGVILLASLTGAPIIPMVWATDRYMAFNSWDRTVIPKPFARLEVFFGEPLSVPKKLKSADLEKFRLELEERMNSLYGQAWGMFGRKAH